jgi:hypothetical protein
MKVESARANAFSSSWLQKITLPWRTIILNVENAQPERKGRMYSYANKYAANIVTRKALPPTPPYPPGGINFPKNLAD